jgi:hypothetical protein
MICLDAAPEVGDSATPAKTDRIDPLNIAWALQSAGTG